MLRPPDTLRTDELLVLPLQNTAPTPPTASRWIRADDLATQVISLQHADPFNTLFAEVRFPAGALRALDGAPLAAGDSVLVTAAPQPGAYGVTVSPAGLEFAAGALPLLRFSFARYGEFGIVASSPTYEDATAYAAALEVWEETGLGRWSVAPGSAAAGPDAVSATVPRPGTFLVAAPR